MDRTIFPPEDERKVRRIFNVNHVLSRRNRFKLCCLKTWSCERMVSLIIIVLSFSILVACGLMISRFVEREWISSLVHGTCTSRNCVTNNEYDFSTMVKCYCSMEFIPSLNDTTFKSQYFNQTFTGKCPNDGDHFSYICWRNEINEIWVKIPDLWLVRLLVILVGIGMCFAATCFMFACTHDSNLLDNIADKEVNKLIRAEFSISQNRRGINAGDFY